MEMAVSHSQSEIRGLNNSIYKIALYKITEDRVFFRIFSLVTCIKLLLIPTYYSTDFEVHRNWLAITHSLAVHEWYTSEKSQWTLDYPPLFAWFEYFLSQFAVFIDDEMLKVDNINYTSCNTIVFQRTSVIIADFFLAIGVREIGKVFLDSAERFFILSFLSLANVGLLIVDHVHFQYNGFFLGILLYSLAKVSKFTKKGNVLKGAAWFAILVNLKHIYVYVAPAYAVWLLRWCHKSNLFLRRIIKLGFIVLSVFAFSFWPFRTQMFQVSSRLFPFKRGLLHAYWAANIWALYAAFDKVLSLFWKNRGWLHEDNQAKLTGGLVRMQSFSVLPTPSPLATFIITVLTMLPILWSLFFKPNSAIEKYFLKCLVVCGLSSFIFGWHVHEKAILTSVIPLRSTSFSSRRVIFRHLSINTVNGKEHITHPCLTPYLISNQLLSTVCLKVGLIENLPTWGILGGFNS
ncbi:probable dolichyl pyrophosphate Glc1Man9GlcNAc2 alpha-1,3-glucosyltransferase isoform X2 [Belonocnema kinseyi]|uniref:probable dolichyl pyrophosphate Glc1Man9GlcNAc2 alpha-1,3-glucosyltransferase isoform X2 n=1 Tax=Belonocnema kinseyi TaxID=2817044 RepID=UPI00143D47BE|nr:probable dolichyl pyrophosphate Glc1Man9GlcNAc2 alpha-1,3-glucosyltransferase isoform X2 [Belonocnema kinseyi]